MNRRIYLKRKTEEQSAKISYDQELKRSKFVGAESIPIPSPFSNLQEPRVDNPPVYHLYNSYADDPVSRYLTDSSWPHDYTIGMSNSGQHGASLSSNISSGSNLVPPVSTFGIHGWNSQSSSDMLMDDRFARSIELGNRACPGPSYSTEGVPSVSRTPSFAVASQSSVSDLYRFADSVGEGEYTRGSDMLGTMRPPNSSYRS